MGNPNQWVAYQSLHKQLIFFLKEFIQLPLYSRTFLLSFLANSLLTEDVLTCVQGQREKVKLQSILLNFFMMMVEKLTGNVIVLANI